PPPLLSFSSCPRSVLLQFPIERRLADAQQACRLQLVSIQLRNRVQDSLPLQFRHGNNLTGAIASTGERRSLQLADFPRKIAQVNHRTGRKSAGALQTILKL